MHRHEGRGGAVSQALRFYPPRLRAQARLVLVDMLAFYENPDHWTQNVFYRDISGVVCPAERMHSCCLSGASSVSKHNTSLPGFICEMSPASVARVAMMDANNTPGICSWNDAPGRTISEVRQFIQNGIDYIDTSADSQH